MSISSPGSLTFEEFVAILGLLMAADIAPDPSLRLVEDLGLDSIGFLELVLLVEDVRPGTTVDEEAAEEVATVGDLFEVAKAAWMAVGPQHDEGA